jgi:hypothetical protein
VRLATIKYLARCPCPRCLIPKDRISNMGNRSDRCQRENIRVDSERRQADVEMTRSWIFQRGYPVDGPQVKAKLGPTSAVPIRVRSHFSTLSISHLIATFRMRFHCDCFISASIFFRCSFRTFCTSLNLAFGNIFLPTSFESYMRLETI